MWTILNMISFRLLKEKIVTIFFNGATGNFHKTQIIFDDRFLIDPNCRKSLRKLAPTFPTTGQAICLSWKQSQIIKTQPVYFLRQECLWDVSCYRMKAFETTEVSFIHNLNGIPLNYIGWPWSKKRILRNYDETHSEATHFSPKHLFQWWKLSLSEWLKFSRKFILNIQKK